MFTLHHWCLIARCHLLNHNIHWTWGTLVIAINITWLGCDSAIVEGVMGWVQCWFWRLWGPALPLTSLSVFLPLLHHTDLGALKIVARWVSLLQMQRWGCARSWFIRGTRSKLFSKWWKTPGLLLRVWYMACWCLCNPFFVSLIGFHIGLLRLVWPALKLWMAKNRFMVFFTLLSWHWYWFGNGHFNLQCSLCLLKGFCLHKAFSGWGSSVWRWSVPSHYGGWAAEIIIGLNVSTPSTSATALQSSPLCCSGQNFPVTVSSRWKGSKSLREAVCVLLVFLSKTRRMLKLGWWMGKCPLPIQARAVEPLQVSKALISPIRTLMMKSRIKANRKKASLNMPKQETADCEKGNWAARGSPSYLSCPGKSQETMENATLWWTAWKSLSLSLEMCIWPWALQTTADDV